MKVLAAAEVGEAWPGFWAASMAQRRSVSASFCCIFTYSCRSRARCFCSLATSSVAHQGRADKMGSHATHDQKNCSGQTPWYVEATEGPTPADVSVSI